VKKLMLVVLFLVMAAGLAMAQGYTGNIAYIPTVDVLGAHQNGGRGCAGCHAPHSGARGNGWAVTTASLMNSGDQALWGTDVTAIMGASITFDPGDGGVQIPWTPTTTSFKSDPLFKDVATCLSCHDGNVSKGAMMTGVSWEQAQGILPAGYGGGSIPTYLGNDGNAKGDYSNDHPVGPGSGKQTGDGATINAGDISALVAGSDPNSKITLTVSATGRVTVGAITGRYAQFVADYGAPQLNRWAALNGDTDPQNLFVVCTTCHDQHSMVAYQSGNHGAVPIAGAGTYQTYFFVAAPYNPGAAYDKTHAPSTDQFCRQCHWPQANESYGATTIGTAF
jgi:hypothetical protein